MTTRTVYVWSAEEAVTLTDLAAGEEDTLEAAQAAAQAALDQYRPVRPRASVSEEIRHYSEDGQSYTVSGEESNRWWRHAKGNVWVEERW